MHIPDVIDGMGARIYPGDYSKIKRLVLDSSSCNNKVVFENVESVTFNSNVYAATAGAFANSANLSKVCFRGSFPRNKDLEGAFKNTPWYKSIMEHNGLVVLGDTVAFSYNCSGDVVVPEGVKMIGPYAFVNEELGKKSSLKRVWLPEGLADIEAGAFAGTGLESINLPSTLKTMSSAPFADTPFLESIRNPDGYAICGKWLLDANLEKSELNIPSGVTHIGGGACSTAKADTITLPDGVEYIGYTAFRNAEFKKIVIPNTVTCVEPYALKSIFNLDEYKDSDFAVLGSVALLNVNDDETKAVTIPDGVKCVSVSDAIGISKRLASLTLPDSVCSYRIATAVAANEIIFKGKTYHTIETKNADYIAERAALKAAIEGN